MDAEYLMPIIRQQITNIPKFINITIMKPVRRKGSKLFILVAECNGKNLKMYK